MSNTTKVGYILCYKDPDYIRTRTLLHMLDTDEYVEVATAINRSRKFYRYIETVYKTLKLRLGCRPDVYVLGFRGYEIYWPVRLLTLGKPLVFDEFINLHDWFVREHEKVTPASMTAKALKLYMKTVIKTSQTVLADTNVHALSSSETYDTDIARYLTLYVGADEKLFTSAETPRHGSERLHVFFYGTFLPLHGMSVILAAAAKLKGKPIDFTIIGGASRSHDMRGVENYLEQNGLENVTHKPWVDFEALPGYIADSDVCLGGPFGGTPQANKVITGKTFQFLAMEKLTIIGETQEQAGFADEENCLIVPQDSPDKLAAAIEWVYEHPDRIDAIAEAGHDLYERRFSVGAQSPRFTAALKDLAR